MRIAVLAKQVPRPAELSLADGRLVRDGVGVETNAYCRRANARAVQLAGDDGEVVVFSMGPPSAELTLREMVACGATRGVLISDRALAGSDTLITARVLAAAIRRAGPFDIVLTGAYSLDSETGHIGVQVAELLGLPFVGPCRALEVVDGVLVATVESDGGFVDAEVLLPALASAAERLCAPSKASPEQIAAVPAARISRVSAEDLGLAADRVGLGASPTQVGDAVRGFLAAPRRRVKTASLDAAVALLAEVAGAAPPPAPVNGAHVRPIDPDRAGVWCVPDAATGPADRAFVAAVTQAARAAGRPAAIYTGDPGDGLPGPVQRLVRFAGPNAPVDWVRPLSERMRAAEPHCVVIEATNWGRELAARLAARVGWGLVGDAVALTVDGDDLVAWKSAFSGQALVPITSRSPTLLVTVRPGALAGVDAPVGQPPIHVETVPTNSASRVIYSAARELDPASREVSRAARLVVVGAGVRPEDYERLEPLRALLGAGPLAGTRKVTDQGWLPRSRQIGITGRAVAPELIVSIGASGKFNHAVAFSRATRVLAINQDPDAPIFDHADVGIVGDWTEVVPDLCDRLRTAAGIGQVERL